MPQQPTYEESSEDGLLETATRPMKKTLSRKKAAPVESDFKDDVEADAVDESSEGPVSDASHTTMSVDEASNEDVDDPKGKIKTPSRAAPGGSANTSGNTENKTKGATSKKIYNLIKGGTGSARGLEKNLPPLHNI